MEQMTQMLEDCAENGWPVVEWAQWPPTAQDYFLGADWQKRIHPSIGYWKTNRWRFATAGFIHNHRTIFGEWDLNLR